MTVCGIKHADGVCVMGKCPYIKMCCPTVWDKSGEPMTNEEWFCQLPTYKKAAIMTYIHDALELDKYAVGKHVVVEEWLKQPHT